MSDILVTVLCDIKNRKKNIKDFDLKIKKVKKCIIKNQKRITAALKIKEQLILEINKLEDEVQMQLLDKQALEEKLKLMDISKKGPTPPKGTNCALCNVEFKRKTRCTYWLKCTICSRFRCTACLTRECDCYKFFDSPESPAECAPKVDEGRIEGSQCCVCKNLFNRQLRNNKPIKCDSCENFKCKKCTTKKCCAEIFAKKSGHLEKLINNLKSRLSENH